MALDPAAHAPHTQASTPGDRPPLTAGEFLARADHTLLAPEATEREVRDFVRDARVLGAARVCISPTMLESVKDIRDGLELVTVVGFPSGAHRPEIKAAETARAVADGADEIDVVVNRGLLREAVSCGAGPGSDDPVVAEIRAVRAACPGRVLKVILETAALTDAEIVWGCRAAEVAGADFVKTSTGFSPDGGASTAAVRLMAETVRGRLGVKASGGIRTAAAAGEMWEAGATRFGVSGTRAIAGELRALTDRD